eukprot:6414295-Pyramimonas_sp.AAC.1
MRPKNHTQPRRARATLWKGRHATPDEDARLTCARYMPYPTHTGGRDPTANGIERIVYIAN